MRKLKPIIIYLLIIVWGLIIVKFVQPHYPSILTYESYIVQQNDTLWGIARQYNPDTDTRYVIFGIEEFNHIKTDIRVGQSIEIPIFESDTRR